MLPLSLRVYRVCAHHSSSLAREEEGGFSCPGQDEEGDLSEGGRVTLTQGSQLWVHSVWSTGSRGRPEGTVSFQRGEANSWAALASDSPCLGQMKLPFPLSH